MKLNKLQEEIHEAVNDAVRDALIEEKDTAYCTVSTDDGYIDIEYSDNEDIDVTIYHDNEDNNHPCYNEHERPCENLSMFISDYIVNNIGWQEIEEELEEEAYNDDVWHRNGFESEADYNNYRYGTRRYA